jgi:hypothetical protein
MTVKVLNTGSATWSKGNTNLGTSQPQNRSSSIYDTSWLSPSRPATLTEQSVIPGQYGTFEFWANTPNNTGYYKEYFNVVSEGVTWMNDMGLHFALNVQPAKYTWASEGQQVFTDSTKLVQANTSNLVTGDRIYMTVKARNTGNTTWYKHSANFATSGPNNRISSVRTNEWLSPNRSATLVEAAVEPGQLGTFEFWMSPTSSGSYKEYFNLVAEGISWMNDIGFYQAFNVAPATYIWQPAGQGAFTDEIKSTPVDTNNLAPGQRIYLEIKARNTGNTTWYKGNLNLATNGPRNRSSKYYDSTWMSVNRPSTLQEISVAPGQIGTFGFWVTAPAAQGISREYFNFVSEYNAWLNDLGLYYQFTVR